MSKRLLVITEGGNAWPSGWVRALIYKDLFESQSIYVQYMSRQSPFLVRLLRGSQGRRFNRLMDFGLRSILKVLNFTFMMVQKRLILWKARQGYDVIYLQKNGTKEFVSALRRVHRGRIVFDLNDAVWLPANASYYANGKVAELLQSVDAVTCDNPSGLAFAQTFNEYVFLVPDPAQVELFDRYRSKVSKSNNPLIIGWIGTPLTLFNLFSIWEALEIVFSRHENILLRLVGTGHDPTLLPRFEKVRFSCVPYYSQMEMVQEVLMMNIGLFPLFNIEDSMVRGILKAVIYMSGETAVIASPRGQVSDLIQDGVNGMLANSTQEWVDKLEGLIADQESLMRIASQGLETVRRNFSLDVSFRALLDALDLQ